MIYKECQTTCKCKDKLHQCRRCSGWDCDVPFAPYKSLQGVISFNTPRMRIHLECLVEMMEKILDKQ